MSRINLTTLNIILYQYLVLNVVNRSWCKNRIMSISRNIGNTILCVAHYSMLREIDFWFISNWKEYDRSDSFSSDYQPNGFSFGSKSKVKLSPRSYSIQFERKWKYSFFSVAEPDFLPDIYSCACALCIQDMYFGIQGMYLGMHGFFIFITKYIYQNI